MKRPPANAPAEEQIVYLRHRLARANIIRRSFQQWRGDEAEHARDVIFMHNAALRVENRWLTVENEKLKAFIEKWADNA